MKKNLLISGLIIAGFLAYKYSKYFFAYLLFGRETWNELDVLFKMTLILAVGLVLASAISCIIAKRFSLTPLGLKRDFLKGAIWGFVFTLPMFIGYGFQNDWELHYSSGLIYRDLFLAGFGEEFIFRGFLFGLLFHFAGWGFIPASLLAGLFFGGGHIYQAGNFSEAVLIFAFTTLASAGFSWFYLAWNSLWMLIFLHGFMDLSWDLYTSPDNVLGDSGSNIFRLITLSLVVVMSIRMAMKHNTLSIRGKLWYHS